MRRNTGASANLRHPNDRAPRIEGIVLERLVAQNDLAAVYQGLREGAPVAVKIYSPSVLGTPRPSERASRERRAQMSLDHPCISRLIDSGQTESGAHYLVSQWAHGKTLEARLSGTRSDWAELRPIAIALVRALRAIHAASMVHRDVKPSNVVLPESGDPPAILLDFGHVLLLEEARLTESGWSLGTAAYMAPEQANGITPDGRADLYSLGVILYRALTGTLPFDHPSPAVVVDLHRYEPVLQPKKRVSEIPDIANDLVMWLLEKNPDNRAPSANVLLHTIR
jgi:serine/threonine-protein kinase